MKLKKLLRNTGYTAVNGLVADIDIKSIVMDTRKVKKGCLFFCIKGLHFDSHNALNDIINGGAAAVVIDRDVDISDVTLPILKVENSRAALASAAVIFYGNPDEMMRLIGVTGTNGKTSTTYFIESLLKEAGKTTGVIGTIGVKAQDTDLDLAFATSTTPDTLELMEILKALSNENADSVVMEVSSHALDQCRVDCLSFKVGVFTNLTQDHLDYHGSMENYFAAKAKLFKQCEYGVINADDEWGMRLASLCKCKVLTYGIDSECDLRGTNIKCSPDGVSYELKYLESFAVVNVPIPGRFTVYNSLAAIATGFALNIPMNTIIEGMSKVKNIPGRIQSIPNELGASIIVDYAHTPDGLREIIKTVRQFSKRVITVFGCGGDRDKTKRPIMGEIAGKLSDYCIITSDNPRSEDPDEIISEIEQGIRKTTCKYKKVADRKKAIYAAIDCAKEGDSVIIAGKGHEDYQELKDETIYFDDASVVRDAVGNIKSKNIKP